MKSFGVALGTSIWKINAIIAVMFEVSAKIPARNVMGRPGAMSGGGLKYENLVERRRKQSFVKIKSTVELGLGREARVDARGIEQV